MTSLRESVVMPGVLRGEGHQRGCQVRAIKVTTPNAPSSPAYARPDPVDLNDDFPDGEYELIVGEQTFRLVKRDGKYEWLVRSLGLWRITGLDWVDAEGPLAVTS
ncbi:MAG TPA: hypothetical protein VLL05_11025 [Terriglobales bacterium]|nr:hypothetical protein [Terriglobales bacterium]